MRLIDADAAVEKATESDKIVGTDIWYTSEVVEFLDDCPTVDAAPVVHGRWVDMGDFQSCSICQATRLKEIGIPYGKAIWVKTPFCPDCGANMDLKEDNHGKTH